MTKKHNETTVEQKERELMLNGTQTLALVDMLTREIKKIEKTLSKNPANVQKSLYLSHIKGIKDYLNNYLQKSLDV